jgi:threonine/homoserine/homoserine lactone efflux protein
MTPEQALAFFLFSVAAAGTPGPSNAMLTAVGANVGVRRGLPCLLGIALGMGSLMFLVAFGLGSLIVDRPGVLRGLRWGGAAFLCWLAWRIATAGGPGPAEGRRPIGLVGAAALQWINPKAWLVCASASTTFLEAGTASAFDQAAGLGLVFVAAALPSCFPWLAFGALLQRVLRSERARRLLNGAMGALLAASVLQFAW